MYEEKNEDAEKRAKHLVEKFLELCCGYTYQTVSIALTSLNYRLSSVALIGNWEKELSPHANDESPCAKSQLQDQSSCLGSATFEGQR